MMVTGWLVANILMPIGLPLAGMLTLLLLLGRRPTRPPGLHIMSVVKDGQLCWAVIGMETAALYDLWEASAAHRVVPAWSSLAQIGLLALMLPAMVLAAGGAVLTTPLMTAPLTGSNPVGTRVAHSLVFVMSASMAIIAAVVYGLLHYRISAGT